VRIAAVLGIVARTLRVAASRAHDYASHKDPDQQKRQQNIGDKTTFMNWFSGHPV